LVAADEQVDYAQRISLEKKRAQPCGRGNDRHYWLWCLKAPAQALNLKDNGFRVIIGQRRNYCPGIKYQDGWIAGIVIYLILEQACEKGCHLLFIIRCRPNATNMGWPKPFNPGKTFCVFAWLCGDLS